MNVQLITIGDEILIGQIVDTNSAWMGQQLNLIGAQIDEIRSIGDEREQILTALNDAVGKVDVVLITGGLGPT
ncbi:MAG: molybdopterin-binding protein, partial [Saprospiraceae bacterium]